MSDVHMYDIQVQSCLYDAHMSYVICMLIAEARYLLPVKRCLYAILVPNVLESGIFVSISNLQYCCLL